MLSELPIDRVVAAILANLRQSPNLVIEGAPGCGKTTRVPIALLALGGEVIVLEPRRVAARMAARRVAEESGERVGQTVGYQVRFEEASSAQTRLRFLTEGVLTRRLISDPELRSVKTIVLDEFHERHLETDLALALLRRLQTTTRPDLRIVVMSATLDAAPIRRYLGDCPLVKSEGRQFPIEIRHLPYSAAPLERQVASALERSLGEQQRGDILVFLPGSAEIRRAQRECTALAQHHGLLLLPLYGDLSPAEQDLALLPAEKRKVILATNIAESSITIEGVAVVIDSGLARIASDSPWTGLPLLEISRISKASANQRAGRAGRTGPGRVLRLYSIEDFERRAEHDAPEILRRSLAQLVLQLRAMNLSNVAWFEAPPQAALEAAETLLSRLGANGRAAAAMAKMPLHPRLARLVLSAIERGVGEDGCKVAARLSSGDRVRFSDLLHGLDEEQLPRTQRVYEPIRRIARPARQASQDDDALALSILDAFPDRVAKRRAGNEYLLSGGTPATTNQGAPEFLVAVDIEERSENPLPVIRLMCPIRPDWLLDQATDRTTVEWNRAAERVDIVEALVYDGLVLEQTRAPARDSDAATALLTTKVFDAGIEHFIDAEALDAFVARVDFASRYSSIKPITDAEVRAALEDLIAGLNSFAQVRAAASRVIAQLAESRNRGILDSIAPEHLRLPSGRNARIRYELNKTPSLASRLQDFFGVRETPCIAGGQVPLVLELLAPNHRPVQTTTDLAGFWTRLYPQLRRELGRRYPRHAWPESPV